MTVEAVKDDKRSACEKQSNAAIRRDVPSKGCIDRAGRDTYKQKCFHDCGRQLDKIGEGPAPPLFFPDAVLTSAVDDDDDSQAETPLIMVKPDRFGQIFEKLGGDFVPNANIGLRNRCWISINHSVG